MDTQGDWTSTVRRMWLWPVAILLGFPIGGLIADLVVNGVDSVGTAIAAGLIAGAIIGAAEWFAAPDLLALDSGHECGTGRGPSGGSGTG